MSHPHYEVAEAYLAAVTAGDLPDSLLTEPRFVMVGDHNNYMCLALRVEHPPDSLFYSPPGIASKPG